MLPLSGDCQEVLIDRDILVRVASQLDSFEVIKDIEKKYIAFKDSCVMLTKTQSDYIPVSYTHLTLPTSDLE